MQLQPSGAEHCKRDVNPAVLGIDVAVLIARVDADLEALTSAFKLPKIRDEGLTLFRAQPRRRSDHARCTIGCY